MCYYKQKIKLCSTASFTKKKVSGTKYERIGIHAVDPDEYSKVLPLPKLVSRHQKLWRNCSTMLIAHRKFQTPKDTFGAKMNFITPWFLHFTICCWWVQSSSQGADKSMNLSHNWITFTLFTLFNTYLVHCPLLVYSKLLPLSDRMLDITQTWAWLLFAGDPPRSS